jgi:hypothetical protein
MMKALLNRKTLVVIFCLFIAVMAFTFSTHLKPVDFNTEVKPLINKKCISCHGGVKSKAGFSLLFRSEALSKTESGKPAIIPGQPENSELIRRITLKDPEERMPYRHAPLSEQEISTFKRWIKEGAQWGDHWVYLPVKQVEVPDNTSWLSWFTPADKNINNDIDRFINDKLQKEELTPNGQADKVTLLRRAGLDLTGLPPAQLIAQQFLQDSSTHSYEVLIDSLLASPHYGERWAAIWLDLARYADTKGYERDDERKIWRYRDYLINAFNKDKPYNEFLTEQIAGDLMPGATDDQLIATAFHRNTMTNDEGGTDNEEFRTAAVLDRVNTTWETLMGTSFSCVQCHSHPYDPFKHEEYYKFAAFFNNTRDEDTFDDYPFLRHMPSADSLKLVKLVNWLKINASEKQARDIATFLKTWQPAVNSLTADQFVNSELADTKWLVLRKDAVARLKNISLDNKTQLSYRFKNGKTGGVWTIHLNSARGATLKTIKPDTTSNKWAIGMVDFTPVKGVHDIYFTYSNPTLKNENENGIMFDWFYFGQPFPGVEKQGYGEAKTIYDTLLRANFPTTPVMMENPDQMRRTTNVFERGNWLTKGKVVLPGVPKSLNPMPRNAPANRLGLAMWLTSKQNPLTARTMVNRVWEQLFGVGLVETLEDLGTQGAAPTHQELLDYLSWKFMNDYNWSVKRLVKEIMLSATYMRDSKATPELLNQDPFNKWYARGARVRLSAEQVRDQALFVGGVLSEKMYGPSVMPFQPEGIWQSPYNGRKWKESPGEDKHRRALYIYWKRTAPYPSMMTFDGAAREVCTARRIRTNTPLQALVTLNDEVYLEAARNFAYRMQKEAGSDPKSQIRKGYEIATYTPISSAKSGILAGLYYQSLKYFKADKDKTCEMIGMMNEHNNPETAALVVVANAMLNLDEVITKN